MRRALLGIAGSIALIVLGTLSGVAEDSAAAPCADCIRIRIGPPMVIRGPFPDELDAPFTALRLADGSLRGFSANGTTFAIDGASLSDMGGERRPVLDAGPAGSINECGRWLTSVYRRDTDILGFVHQERACDYDKGQTDKSMAIARSDDDGLTWTDLGTVITGMPAAEGITGEGDCTMVDGFDGYLYGYCLRNTDWKTIVARARPDEPTVWNKFLDGQWDSPGMGGDATSLGFIGTGVAYLKPEGWVAAITNDPWFGGLRLSLAADKVSFVDLDEPLVPIDGADWNRPAPTSLIAYTTLLNPEDGSNVVGDHFVLSYTYVPGGKGFDSRYLVEHEVTLEVADAPVPVQAGMALSRWSDAGRDRIVTSTGPLTGERQDLQLDAVVGYLLTRAPTEIESIKLAECSRLSGGQLDQMLAPDGECEAQGYTRERTAGWLFAAEQADSAPIYSCRDARTGAHFASGAADCEGLGTMITLLGYGLTQ